MRNTIIAGNWKMNKTPQEAREFIKELKPMVSSALCKVICCVPFLDIPAALEEASNSNIIIAAQNCHYEKKGAFTGEISAPMLKSINVDFVILGHSERRTYFGENDETINFRLISAIEENLNVILCVGETLAQREQDITEETIAIQLKSALKNINIDNIKQVVIAYEPVWAIGTGKTATAEQAEQVCAFIRKIISDLYNESIAKEMSVLYGGSMNATNAVELLRMPNINGGLIGGASLRAEEFSKIVNFASAECTVNGG